MNCPICGAENAPETKFCVGCGSALSQAAPAPAASTYSEPTPATAPSTDGAKKLPVKAILFGVLGIVAVVLLISLISSLLSGGNGFIEYKQSILLVSTDEDEYSVVVGKKTLKTTIKSESYPDISYSLDGTAACVVTDEGELYVISGKKIKQVKDAEDVQSAIISNNGKGVAYLSMGEDDEFSTLYLAKVSNAKSTKVSEDVVGSYKIAPDGKSVAYFKDGGDDPAELMYSKGKKATKITDDEGAKLYGLSNGGKQIYVSISEDGESDLYSFNAKGKKNKIGDIGYPVVYFNDDHTQACYFNEDGKTHISTKGKEGKKVRNDVLAMIIAPNSAMKDTTYPTSNLYNHVYANSEGDIYMIKKNKDIKLVGSASDYQLDASGKYLYYVHKGDELKVLKISKGEKASEKAKIIIDDDFSSYYVTSDRKFVYFYDGEDLMSVNGKKGGNPKEITDELNANAGIAISSKDILYYVVDDELFAVSNGKKGKKVLGDVDQITNNVAHDETDILYSDVYAVSDGKLFGTTGSKGLKQILEFED